MKRVIDIPMNQIKEEEKKNFESILKKKNLDINDFEQIIKILKLNKTTQCKLLNLDSNSTYNQIVNNGDLSIINNPYFSFILNYVNLYQNDSQNNLLLSSLESTTANSEVIENTSKIIVHDFVEKKFNNARISHCLKNKLYDITLTIEFSNFNHPIKYKISDEKFAFVYPSDLIITFCITVSGFIFKNKMLNNDKISSEYKGSKFNQILGLFFCGKNIKLNENTIKKCAPNEFICKSCVEINKKIYNLKDHYLINIYGRISKQNKGVYHCFGNFLVNNQIEECITSYVCKGCSFLNSFSNYYNS